MNFEKKEVYKMVKVTTIINVNKDPHFVRGILDVMLTVLDVCIEVFQLFSQNISRPLELVSFDDKTRSFFNVKIVLSLS